MKGSNTLPGMWLTKIVTSARPRQKSIAFGSRIGPVVALRESLRNTYAVAIRGINAQHGPTRDGIGGRSLTSSGWSGSCGGVGAALDVATLPRDRLDAPTSRR